MKIIRVKEIQSGLRTVEARSRPMVVMPDLGLYGVEEHSQHRNPSAYVFPNNFNGDVRKLWDSLFKDDQFRQGMKELTPAQQWRFAISEFLKTCRQNEKPPFQPHYLDSENGKIGNSIKVHRSAVHDILRKTGLLDTKIKSARPEVNRHSTGFGFSVNCKFNPVPRWGSIAEFTTHLLKSGFSINSKGQYELGLNPELSLVVDARKNPVFTYSIRVNRHPFINGWQLITKDRYANFVVNRIWRKLVQDHPSPHPRFRL